MATIQFGGVVSGLNTQGIIDAMVAVKKQPLTNLQTREATLTSEKAAYGQVGTALDDLVAKLQAFTSTSAGAGRAATSTDTSLFTATASVNAAVSTYQISVDRVATATRATSSVAMGAPVTDTSQALQALNLPGSVTAGQVSAIVDGTIVHYTVGDPSTTTLDQVMTGLGQAITSQLAASDPTATATVSVVNNRLQIAISGATTSHSLSFGAASDTSNALGILGIASLSATVAVNGAPPTGATNLGVARLSGTLDAAGLSGLASTTTGTLTINGVAINYDTTTDSLSGVISRINNSSAGVIASVDRTNDKLVLTRTDTGSLAIDISDTSGTLGAALNLAPGTTIAQVIGATAQVTINGQAVTSSTNTITNAIDGVTLNLLKQSPIGETQTLSVDVDQDAITSSLQTFVKSFNSLGDTLDKLTAMTPGQAGGTAGSSGPLATDPTIQGLFLSLRSALFQSSGTGAFSSLGSIGLNTGDIGSVAGSTDRLQLDTTKLSAALNTDAKQVASLLDGATGPLATLLAKIKTFEDPSSTSAYIQGQTSSIASQVSSLHGQEASLQEMIDNYQTALEAQYASMEATLAQLQSQSAQLASTLGYSTSSSSSTTNTSG
jgi:flagellar hook-associated protein 2